MLINRISGKAVLGLEEFGFDLGRITRISGGNAAGKSSLLAALKASLGGGNLARLARVGDESEPETVLVIDAGALQVERAGDRPAKVLKRVGDSAAYEKVRQPQKFLNTLFDPDLTNPLLFLQAKPEEQAQLLLEALPLHLDPDELRGCLAGLRTEIPNGHPLAVLADLRQSLYDERTGVNVSAKDKERTAHELQLGLPARIPDDISGEIEKLREAVIAAQREVDVAGVRCGSARREAEDAAKTANDTAAQDIASDFKIAKARREKKLEEEIAALRATAEADIAGMRTKAEEALTAAARESNAAIAEAWRVAEVEQERIAREDQPKLDAARAALTRAEEQQGHVAQQRANASLVKRLETERDELKGRSDKLSRAMDRLDAYRLRLADNLPIPGLEVRDGRVLLDGVSFDQVNTAMRMRVAVQVAALRAKSMPLPALFIDGVEALDAEGREALLREVEPTGCQVFMSEVTEGPLRVEALA